MLFKDQASELVAKWESLRDDRDLQTLAAQTAIALSKMPDVPEDVLNCLDELLGDEYESNGSSTYQVMRYLRSLCEENRDSLVTKPRILTV